MKTIREQVKGKPWLGWVYFGASMVVVFLLGLLASSISERRAEAIFAYTPEVSFADWEPRNEVWGENFPREYQSYIQTADTTFRSKHNGNATIDFLADDPRLVVLWAGYAFSKDYKQGRGHAYAITDIRNTLRTGAPTEEKPGTLPNTCWTCKSPDVPRLMREQGVDSFYKGHWETKGAQIVNHIGCADCHDAKNMNLHISRPALVEAFKRQGKDVTKATQQEMRSLVCAQCHVEYYFKGDGKYLTFPWDKGFAVEDMEQYYDSIKFSDWKHALSRTPMLKAQHPDFEVYKMGIHADRGVSCADCHMPYKSEGGVKFTNHKIMSPLANVANTCQVCHRQETDKLVANVYQRQDAILQNRNKLEEILVRAHVEAKLAWDKGAKEDEMADVLKSIRAAQWRWDYSAAGHGNSFHAPVEISRIIGQGINRAQEARLLLSRILSKYGVNTEVPYPDIDTKAKAQAYIGLDMKKLNADKAVFINTTLPIWDKKAADRESKYPVKRLNQSL